MRPSIELALASAPTFEDSSKAKPVPFGDIDLEKEDQQQT
jgi:hypothetical protein